MAERRESSKGRLDRGSNRPPSSGGSAPQEPHRTERTLAAAQVGHDGAQLVLEHSSTSGVLPSPKELADYAAVDAGLVGTIVGMATLEQRNRHTQEARLIEHEIQRVEGGDT